MHFSYGHFFQVPRFERLYENPDFKIGFGTGNQGVVGNADLEPEQTINAEIGLQQQLTADLSVDVTAYLRDIRGLTGTRADEIVVFGGSAKYSKYVNSDFGFVKGIVLTLNKRFGGGFSATLDYTYQVAKGSASDPQEARNAVAGGSLPEVQLTPLGWDQRHTLNVTRLVCGAALGRQPDRAVRQRHAVHSAPCHGRHHDPAHEQPDQAGILQCRPPRVLRDRL